MSRPARPSDAPAGRPAGSLYRPYRGGAARRYHADNRGEVEPDYHTKGLSFRPAAHRRAPVVFWPGPFRHVHHGRLGCSFLDEPRLWNQVYRDGRGAHYRVSDLGFRPLIRRMT